MKLDFLDFDTEFSKNRRGMASVRLFPLHRRDRPRYDNDSKHVVMKTNMVSPKISIEPHAQTGFVLTAELVIDRGIEEVFDFFCRAENLEAITPPWLNFRIMTPTPIEMRKGALIDYRIQLHGLPIKWRTEIEAWQPPHRFVDQQLSGPYKKWYHEHTFESLGANKTLAKDRVHYVSRFGSLVHKYFVKPDLMKIFTYRQEQLLKHFTTLPAPAAGLSSGLTSQTTLS